jgi:ubiquinone biosynthesis protein UbiJ
MIKTDYWTQSAETMELTVEGNHLITQAFVKMARDLRNRLGRALAAMLSTENRHLPPV